MKMRKTKKNSAALLGLLVLLGCLVLAPLCGCTREQPADEQNQEQGK